MEVLPLCGVCVKCLCEVPVSGLGEEGAGRGKHACMHME